jgi:hypothetical protein
MSLTADALLRRWGQMDAEFQRHAGVWRACYDVTFPERADGLQGDVVDAQSAQNKRADLLDSTGTDAARLLASSIHSGLTPANSVWFGLDVGDESDDEKRWLDHAAEQMWEAIHGSNYDSAKPECLLDMTACGWFVLYVDEDKEAGKLTFTQWPIAQCRVAASKPGGQVDTVFRRYKLTAEQAYNEFGDDVSQDIKDALKEKPDTAFEFLWCIYPRADHMPGGRMAKRLPVASIHVEVDTKRTVRESGYHEMPCIVPRWLQLASSPYAVGPVSAALPTIRQLNELLRMETIALSRAASGVYVAEDDGVLNPRAVKVRGGSVIVANSVDSIKALPSGADFNVTFSKSEEMRREIRRLMMADQLQPQDGPAMTATEVHVRVAMIRQIMGPLYGRFQSEDQGPTIDRVFGLMYRRGRPEAGGEPGDVALDDPPASLAGQKFRVRYQSPLARSQKLEDVASIERLAQMAGMFAQVGKPEALDLLDADESMRIASDGLGAPGKALKGKKDVDAYRKARQEQAAQEQQAAQGQQLQTMAADAALKRAAAA